MNYPARLQIYHILLALIMILLVLTAGWHPAECSAKPEKVREEENRILAELVALRLQIDSAREEILALEEQLKKNLRDRAAREQELVQIRTDLAASSKELGRWVEFTYRYGYVSILDVLVSASDFNDFLNRSFLLWTIMDQQAGAFQHNRSLRQQVEQQLQQLDILNKSLSSNRARLENTIAELRQKESALEQFLADLRVRSAELEAKLAELSKRWAEVTGLTADIINRFSTLPEGGLEPDRLRFTLGGLRVEYTDDTINRAIQKINPYPSARVNVQLHPGQTVISGHTDHQGISFSLHGNFKITPDQKKIVFVPASITVGDDTLKGDLLKSILDNSDLTWDITRYYPRLSITGVTNGNGKITFDLRY